MYAGCGRAGDFAGDPLLWVEREVIAWLDANRENIRAAWTGDAALPAGTPWVTYRNGVVQAHNAFSPVTFAALVAGVIPNLAAVAVAPGVDSDGAYDPLGGRDVANLVTLKTFFEHVLRGRFRQADTALDRYELFIGTNAQPDLTAAPTATSATLPFTTPVLAAGATYYIVVRKRNVHNLASENVVSTAFVIDAGGNQVNPPQSPYEQSIEPAAAGAGLIRAKYDYLYDQNLSLAANTWAVWYTTDGSEPDTTDDPTYEEDMVFSDGEAKLEYTTPTQAHGTTIKSIVKARRSVGEVDSVNTTVMSMTSDANGPAVPGNAGAFLGTIAKQG